MLHNKRILLGITGSIAAYKSALLARELQRRGAEVRVVMSKAATEFITPLTLATLTDHRVYSDFTESVDQGTWTNHVELGLWADAFLRGASQVVLTNNPISGALILGGLFAADAFVASCGVVGLFGATATAVLLRLDLQATCSGLFGYNGLLVGLGLATFLVGEQWALLVLSLVLGALSTVLACFFLTRATMYPFIKLGVFMMSNMALSAIITLVVLPAVLATVGPPIHLGSLTLTGDVLCRQKVTQKM